MVTHMFGPLFKVIAMMLIDLGKFLVLWVIMLMIFASGSTMIFSRVDDFPTLLDTLLLYFDYSLGSWD